MKLDAYKCDICGEVIISEEKLVKKYNIQICVDSDNDITNREELYFPDVCPACRIILMDNIHDILCKLPIE